MVTTQRLLVMLVPVSVAIYTISFGIWAWRNGHRRGAVGVMVIAALVLVLPVLALCLLR